MPALELHEITRRFGTLTALDNVSLIIRPGTIHALLGENGAGKTTLMRIAFGMIPPDTGWIVVAGVRRRLSSPAEAIAAGIGMVHQHFSLVPAMTVAENVALGGRGLYRFDEAAKRIAEVGKQTGLKLDPSSRVSDLATADRQKLEIVRTLAHGASVLILDEPTAVLTPRDTSELFGQLRLFAESGGSVVLITHRLQDVLDHADEVTVLRRGRFVMNAPVSDVTRSTLAIAMIGLSDMQSQETRKPVTRTDVVAQIHSVPLPDHRGICSDSEVSLELFAGEILGVAALEGAANGLLRILAGRLAPKSGQIELPSHVGFVPENRQQDAIVPEFSLTENFALKGAGKRKGLLRWKDLRNRTAAIVREFDVRADSPDMAAQQLSGGNQQRFVLGRELADNPSLLVLDNPTQGLDVSAAASIHAKMRSACNSGAAVIFFSSDLDEIVELSDRVAVINNRRITMARPDRDEIGRILLATDIATGTSG
ncbi:MAG: ABC transporter ATP-binding protein [Gemmatimonadaceae bacterium]|nr:ABC transporter ATP-binding protein [Gemmatimonadaceae bacterium]